MRKEIYKAMEKGIKFIPNQTKTNFEIQLGIKAVSNLCPITNKYESLEVSINYIPNDYLIDTSMLRNFFNSYQFNEILENIDYAICQFLNEQLKPKYINVEVRCENDKPLLQKIKREINNER